VGYGEGLKKDNMRFNIPFFLITALIFLFSADRLLAQENPRLISFDEALKMAFADDPGLRARDADIEIQEMKVGESTAMYNPRFDIYSSYSRTSLESDIEFVNPLTSMPLTISLFPQDRYNIGFSLSHSFFSFGRRAAARNAARLGVDVSRIDRREYERSIYDNLARVFLRVLLARDNLAIRKADVTRAQKKMEIVRSRMLEGLASDYDSIKAELLMIRYENEKIEAEGDYIKARAALKAILGLSQDEPIMPVGELSAFNLEIPTERKYDPDDQIEISKLNKSIEIQTEMVKLHRRAFLPSLSYNLKYDWQNGYQPDLDKIKGYWTAGLSLNWNLFDGGGRKSRIGRARNEITRSRELKSDLLTYIEAEIRSSEDDIEKAQSEITVAGKRLALAEKGLAIAEARYNEGLLTISDLLDLELEKAEAEIGMNFSLYKLQIARLNLKTALGYYPEFTSPEDSP
jgi:outer membrane protein TolC